ncbi:MAG: hypothetical protein M1834_007363 [Cirrosporium novae-zelandiae]|nr:MAG: hypothetical protein M1834_007363 [Cirrosporium novae-zelandiae]
MFVLLFGDRRLWKPMMLTTSPIQLDVSTILTFIKDLASYEKCLHLVEATEELLLKSLSFPSSPDKGYAKTFLIIAPDDPSSSTTNGSINGTSTKEHPAGMAMYYTTYSTWQSAPGVYLEDLYVDKRYRGRGYGKALLSALAKETQRIGGRRLQWSVLDWNANARGFYKEMGGRELSEWVGVRVEGDKLERLANMCEDAKK